MEKQYPDSLSTSKRGVLLRLLFWLIPQKVPPFVGGPVRRGSDIFVHTLEYFVLNACREYGLSGDAALAFDIALKVTLWIILAGWIIKSAFEVLNDLKDLWKKFRGPGDKPGNPPEGPGGGDPPAAARVRPDEASPAEVKPVVVDARGL